jgi:ribosomal protein S18 acetylase RimI-like enzyme
VGAELIACAEQEAERRGLRLVLDVAADGREAIAFYTSRGWCQVGEAALAPGAEGRALRLVLFVVPDGHRRVA